MKTQRWPWTIGAVIGMAITLAASYIDRGRVSRTLLVLGAVYITILALTDIHAARKHARSLVQANPRKAGE